MTERKFRFGEWLYGESEFNRLLGNGDALIASDGTRYMKFDRMGQDVWVREMVNVPWCHDCGKPESLCECRRRMERAALTLAKIRQCTTPCSERPGDCECIDILNAAFRSEAFRATHPSHGSTLEGEER